MSEIPEDAKPPTPLAPDELGDIVTKASVPAHFTPGLKRVPMYWHPYRTMAKQRWWGREILELVSTEFRDRSIEYYVSRVQGRVGGDINRGFAEIRFGIGGGHCEWSYCEAWDNNQEWG